MKKHKAMQLVKALRSGEYQQGMYQLVNDQDEFCCLGVACNISKQPLEWKRRGGLWEMSGASSTLPAAIQEEFGFYSDGGSRRDGKFFLIDDTKYSDLMDANDSGVSFNDIADYIENNWKAL